MEATAAQGAGIPTRAEAETCLEMAHMKHPGPWLAHSRTTARAAETIAAHCGLHPDDAYALGLLHEVGRFGGAPGLHYTLDGYHLMTKTGYPAAARVCLTHAFPFPNLSAYGGRLPGCTMAETDEITALLDRFGLDNLDMLIQLCAALCGPGGVYLLEVRLVEAARRHGIDAYTLKRWEALFALKSHFDNLCGCSVYTLFEGEVAPNSLR